MHWRNSALQRFLLVTALVVPACDQSEEPEFEGFASFTSIHAAPEPKPGTSDPLHAAMMYEDEDDFAILHDMSNLRPSDMDEDDYRRLLQEPARAELRRQLPDATPPTQADLDLLSLRWFVQGSGFVVQNRSERTFNIAAHFSSSTDSTCEFTVPWKSVGPKASAMYTSHDHECTADHAQVTVNDEYGLFVDSAVVAPLEAR